MFDLDQAIGEWRQGMVARGIETASVLDELESHLRDDIEEQMNAGVEPRQAFEAAVRRIGRARMLQMEFEKVGSLRSITRRIALRGAFIGLALAMIVINSWTLLLHEKPLVERIVGLIGAGLPALYVGSLPYLYWYWRSLNHIGVRVVVKIAWLIVGIWPFVCLLTVFGVIQVELGLTLTTIIWSIAAAIAATAGAGSFMSRSGELGETLGDVPLLADFGPMSHRSLEMARQEAMSFGHDFIGTEHLLLGLFDPDAGSVSGVLMRLGVRREAVRGEVEKLVGSGVADSVRTSIPYTPRAQRALLLAAEQAKAVNRSQTDPEHILLGLLLEGSGVAAVVLKNLGVRSEELREEIRRKPDSTGGGG